MSINSAFVNKVFGPYNEVFAEGQIRKGLLQTAHFESLKTAQLFQLLQNKLECLVNPGSVFNRACITESSGLAHNTQCYLVVEMKRWYPPREYDYAVEIDYGRIDLNGRRSFSTRYLCIYKTTAKDKTVRPRIVFANCTVIANDGDKLGWLLKLFRPSEEDYYGHLSNSNVWHSVMVAMNALNDRTESDLFKQHRQFNQGRNAFANFTGSVGS